MAAGKWRVLRQIRFLWIFFSVSNGKPGLDFYYQTLLIKYLICIKPRVDPEDPDDSDAQNHGKSKVSQR